MHKDGLEALAKWKIIVPEIFHLQKNHAVKTKIMKFMEKVEINKTKQDLWNFVVQTLYTQAMQPECWGWFFLFLEVGVEGKSILEDPC